MDMFRLAADYLRGARSRLKDAESALRRGDYPEVVRYSQEAVELSLKACLRLIGVEYPKVHDVSDELNINSSRFPSWFSERVEELAVISAELANKRAASMYGVEAAGKGPSDLFDRKEADLSLKQARKVYENAEKLYKEIASK
ncbi:MAG: HEPN domain-containing protein [Conexivisphaerales archaeon]